MRSVFYFYKMHHFIKNVIEKIFSEKKINITTLLAGATLVVELKKEKALRKLLSAKEWKNSQDSSAWKKTSKN